ARATLVIAAGVVIPPIACVVPALVARADIAAEAPHLAPTGAAKEQPAEQVLVLDLSRCLAPMVDQPLLRLLEQRLVHDRWYAHADPLGLGAATGGGLAMAPVAKPVARLSRLNRLVLLMMRLPHVHAVAHHLAERARRPPRAGSRLDAALVQAPRDLSQAQPIDADPGEDLAYRGSLALLDHDRTRLMPLAGKVPIAVRRIGPRWRRPAARPMQPSAARAVEDLGALVLREDATHPQRHLLLGRVRCTAMHEDHLHLLSCDLFKHDLLIDEPPRQPIRIVDHDPIEGAQGDGVAQRIEARSQQRISRPPVVDVAMLGIDHVAHGRDMLLNGSDLR